MFGSVNKILQTLGTVAATVADHLTSKWIRVSGHSMHPTLRDGQRVRISRVAYTRRQPKRWDIVFFEHPQQEGFWEVKRVIGLPGETVRLEAGRIIVDENHLDEPFIHGDSPYIDRNWHLASDEYILIGDNRRRSTDSRSFGPVPRDRIVGMAILP